MVFQLNFIQLAWLSPTYCNATNNCPASTSSTGVFQFSSNIFVNFSKRVNLLSILRNVSGALNFRAKDAQGDILMCYKIPIHIFDSP